MNPVASTTGASRVTSGAPVASTTSPSEVVPLPTPGPSTVEGLNDAMSMIYELLSKDGDSELTSRKNDVAGKKILRDKALADEKAAHDRERQDEDGGSGFFGSIVKVVKDVVDDAAHGRIADCVTDGKDDLEAAWNSPHFWKDIESGAGSVFKGINTVFAVAAALATLHGDDAVDIIKNPDSVTARHYGFAGKAALVLAAGIASAATAGVATPAIIAAVSVALSAGGEAVAESNCLGSASSYVGFGLEAGGAATGMLAAPTTNIDRIVTALRGAETMLEGATKVVEGAAHARVAVFDGDAEEARADVKAAQHQRDRIDRLVHDLLTEASDVQKSHERALASLREAMDTNGQSLLIAAGMRG